MFVGPQAGSLMNVTFLAPRILKFLVEFWKISGPRV